MQPVSLSASCGLASCVRQSIVPTRKTIRRHIVLRAEPEPDGSSTPPSTQPDKKPPTSAYIDELPEVNFLTILKETYCMKYCQPAEHSKCITTSHNVCIFADSKDWNEPWNEGSLEEGILFSWWITKQGEAGVRTHVYATVCHALQGSFQLCPLSKRTNISLALWWYETWSLLRIKTFSHSSIFTVLVMGAFTLS